MRQVGTLRNEEEARRFSHFLHQKGIPHQIEVERVTDWGSEAYGTIRCTVWIYEEEQLEEVSEWFRQWQKEPDSPIFATTPPLSSPPPSHSLPEWQPLGPVTRSIIGLCALLLLLSIGWNAIWPPFRLNSAQGVPFSPVEKALLYDYPKVYQLTDRLVALYGDRDLESPIRLPPGGRALFEQINETPFWPGLYPFLQSEGGITAAMQGIRDTPMFEKMHQGEWWRLISPCFLHADLLHLCFNMMWLYVLGKQFEQRMSRWRYFLWIALVGSLSNTAQYLMSGPNFLGFSGVLCGMLAFVWVRQRKAPWEGYQMEQVTYRLMGIFVIGMAGIQLFFFLLDGPLFDLNFDTHIANTAHITGGLTGWLLAQGNTFGVRRAVA